MHSNRTACLPRVIAVALDASLRIHVRWDRAQALFLNGHAHEAQRMTWGGTRRFVQRRHGAAIPARCLWLAGCRLGRGRLSALVSQVQAGMDALARLIQRSLDKGPELVVRIYHLARAFEECSLALA